MLEKKPNPKELRVRATRAGFYNGQRVREGKAFTLKHVDDWSTSWMEEVPATTLDDLAAAENASPKRSTSHGVQLKNPGRTQGRKSQSTGVIVTPGGKPPSSAKTLPAGDDGI